MVKKYFASFFVLLTSIIIIAGCSSNLGTSKNQSDDTEKKPNDNTSQKGGEMVVAYESDVSNFDPTHSSTGNDHALLWPVYDTLIAFTPDLEPQPGLAESWEFPDEMTLVLNLREGVTFHDGTPFDAEAVKFNIERINSENSRISDLKIIESVDVVDPLTVKLHLKEPNFSILMALSDRGGMMVSPTAVQESGENFSQNPVGAGPYKVVGHNPNSEIVYEPYDNYWKEEEPYLNKLTIKIMDDENTRINALKSGEVDFAYNISPGNAETLKNDPNIVLNERISLQYYQIYLNTAKSPLDNKAARLAIQHGIDRQALIQAINFGKGEIAEQPFPKEYWAHDPDLKIDYDPEKAKQILQDAGIENLSFTMTHFSRAYETRIAEAIKGQLSQIGIDVKLEAMELTAATDHFFVRKESHAFLADWTGRADPHITVNNLYTETFFNTGGLTTDEIKSLIKKGASTNEQGERTKIYGEVNKKALLEDTQVFIPLYFSPRASAMNPQVKGFEPNLLGKPMFSDLRMEQ